LKITQLKQNNMTPFKIGNWLITEEGITWEGTPKIDYVIPKERILELGPGDRKNMYDWLIHIPTKTWATEADIYALNSAFVYALTHYGLDLTTHSFVETLIEQQKELKEK
jgi:hypothetical protein